MPLFIDGVEMLFQVEIVETLRKTIEVNCETSMEALNKMLVQYYDEDIVLNDADYDNPKFEVRESWRVHD